MSGDERTGEDRADSATADRDCGSVGGIVIGLYLVAIWVFVVVLVVAVVLLAGF